MRVKASVRAWTAPYSVERLYQPWAGHRSGTYSKWPVFLFSLAPMMEEMDS